MESWRPAFGFEDLYEVSDLGRVRRVAAGKGAKVGNVVAVSLKRNGYCCVTLHRGSPRTLLLHRLVLASFQGNSDAEGDHINGDRQDNRLENLRWLAHPANVSAADNRNDGRPTRRGVSTGAGVQNSQSKLTESQAREIIAIRDSLSPPAGWRKNLADKFDVSLPTIAAVACGRNWKHLQADFRSRP